MRVSFLIGGESVLDVIVHDDRSVGFVGELTGGREVSYDVLLESSGQADKVEGELFKCIVRDLKRLEDVERYIVHEVLNEPGLRAVGVELLKTER